MTSFRYPVWPIVLLFFVVVAGCPDPGDDDASDMSIAHGICPGRPEKTPSIRCLRSGSSSSAFTVGKSSSSSD